MKITVHAKTIDQAVADAAKKLSVNTDQIQYELLSQANAGIFSFFIGKRVEIAAWVKNQSSGETRSSSYSKNPGNRDKNQQKQQPPNSRQKNQKSKQQTSSPKPTRPTAPPRQTVKEEDLPPLTAEQVNDAVADIKLYGEKICMLISGESAVEMTTQLTDDLLEINISNPVIAEMMAENSKLSDALEHLLRKKPRYLKRDLPFRVRVDAAGAREKREKELLEVAESVSKQVIEEQKPVVLNYRSPADRRVIHLALDNHEHVYTKSVGSGSNRRLIVLPRDGSEALES